MAQAVQRGQVTPADELRDLLDTAEKRVANVRGSGEGAVTLLRELDRIAELWPQLESHGVDLRPEAGRWTTLQASVQRRAGPILAELQQQGGLEALRRLWHPQRPSAPWWRLDEIVAENRAATLRRSLIVTAVILFIAVGVWLILKSLTDPNVMEASRRVAAGEQAVQQQGDWSAALAEFQAAAAARPEDYDVWVRVGIANEQLKNGPAAQEAFARARSLLSSDLEFLTARAYGYFAFSLVDQADQDVQAALALKDDDAQVWYLAASVHEARGELQQAVDALEKAGAYAEASGQDELVAASRYRMGMLMQQLSFPQITETPSPSPAP